MKWEQGSEMKYDFYKAINRRNTYSIKYDVTYSILGLKKGIKDFETAGNKPK